MFYIYHLPNVLVMITSTSIIETININCFLSFWVTHFSKKMQGNSSYHITTQYQKYTENAASSPC